MGSFEQALVEKILFKDLLNNDEHERLFRAALRNKDEKLVPYLTADEVLEDMAKALIDEEGRSLHDASEVLGVLLANIDGVTDAFVKGHLPLFFSYLDREAMNPRRLYYFLRVASFLFQTKTAELFAYVRNDANFVPKLVKNLSSVHILQLILNMLKLEDQMRELAVIDCEWSGSTGFLSTIAKTLQEEPIANLDTVGKLLSELANSYTTNSPLMRSVLVIENGAIVSTLVSLAKNKTMSGEAIKLLDEVIIKIVMANKDDEGFFATVADHFKKEQKIFSDMLSSNSLSDVLVTVKFYHALIKHNAAFLLGDGITLRLWLPTILGLISSVKLFFRFPWANILHNVIMSAITHVFQVQSEEMIEQLLNAGLLVTVVKGLATQQPVGFSPHLRAIATAIGECLLPKVQEYLKSQPLWEKYKEAIEVRNDSTLTYKNAEREVSSRLRAALLELGFIDASEIVEKKETKEETTAIEEEKQSQKTTEETETTPEQVLEQTEATELAAPEQTTDAAETTEQAVPEQTSEEKTSETSEATHAASEQKNEASEPADLTLEAEQTKVEEKTENEEAK